MHIILDLLIPRFVTDEIAVIKTDSDDDYQYCEVVARKEELRPDDKYDAIMTVKAFNFFGFGLFPTTIIEDVDHGPANQS